MSLKGSQIRFLRQQAHALKPVVLTGQHGLTEAVINEIDQALAHHELIKVRINAANREEKKAMAEQICQQTRAELVQTVGHIATLFRQNREPSKRRIQLPK